MSYSPCFSAVTSSRTAPTPQKPPSNTPASAPSESMEQFAKVRDIAKHSTVNEDVPIRLFDLNGRKISSKQIIRVIEAHKDPIPLFESLLTEVPAEATPRISSRSCSRP